MNTVYIRFNAGNDTNGNPRRVFVVYNADNGQIITAINEGYAGDQVKTKFPGAVFLGTYTTTPAQCRQLLKEYKDAKHETSYK